MLQAYHMNMKIVVTALLSATRMAPLPAIENAAWLAGIEDQFADAVERACVSRYWWTMRTGLSSTLWLPARA